jgi:hypothetical protein
MPQINAIKLRKEINAGLVFIVTNLEWNAWLVSFVLNFVTG